MKILLLGFSAIGYGTPSIPERLSQLLAENQETKNFEAEYVSLGGLAVDGLSYLIDSILRVKRPDILILEIATSWFSLCHTNQELSDQLVASIVSQSLNQVQCIYFLNLYRRDLSDNDLVVSSIAKVAARMLPHIAQPVLSLKQYYRSLWETQADDLTIDGVHPKPSAIEHIAKSLYEFLYSKLLRREVEHKIEQRQTGLKQLKNKLIFPQLPECETSVFSSRHGYAANLLVIKKNQSLNFDFVRPVPIYGLCFIWGPDTSYLDYSINNQQQRLTMRDEMSFYRRVGFHFFGAPILAESIVLEGPTHFLDIKLQREPWEDVFDPKVYIVGFATDAPLPISSNTKFIESSWPIEASF